jgi:hypothetical protein
LRTAGIEIPPVAKLALQGLYLRHRQANQIRTQALGEILAAYETAGIKALVLKGAALAHLIYPQPGLRAMRDMDILVEKSAACQAQAVLASLEFAAPLPRNGTLPDKHLTPAKRRDAGVTVTVEVHHNLFDAAYPASMGLPELSAGPLSFPLAGSGVMACTLGYEDMLWHLCQHMTLNASVFGATRLIWIADIVSFAEQFANEIDWQTVWRRYPLVVNVLSLLHFMTPLSPTLRQAARLKIGRAPQGIGLDFQGWPRSSWREQRRKGYQHMLRDTFWPSAWWLRLSYGLGSAQPLFWHRWVRHPLAILGWVQQLMLERLGWWPPL